MATTNIYEMAQTWNNGAVDFTAIKMDVTDTASAATSLLLDLQVGGVSQVNVTKGGAVNLQRIIINSGTSPRAGFGPGALDEFRLHGRNPGQPLGYISYSGNLTLWRDADNIFAQRNGLNAQEFRIYNTYTDASNYERGYIRWDGNLRIGTEHSGGSAKSINIESSANLFLSWNGGGATGNGANFYPSSPGATSLGRAPTPWRDLFLRPSSSLTPSANGDLCIEATNNTTLTFKLKGSDGTVRSGTVALS